MPYTPLVVGGLTQEAYYKALVGTVSLFWAPRLTAWDTANAWNWLGRLAPNAYKADTGRTIYDLVSGIPKTPKESFVIEVKGTVEATFREISTDVALIANGNGYREAMMTVNGVGPIATTIDAAPAPTAEQIDLTNAAGFAVDDDIEVEFADGTKRYTRIIALAGTLADVFPRFPAAPAAGDDVRKVQAWHFIDGGVDIQRIALMAIFQAAGNTQVVSHFADARSEGFAPDFKHEDGTEAVVPVMFKLFGRHNATVGGPIVAEKYIIRNPAAFIDPDGGVARTAAGA